MPANPEPSEYAIAGALGCAERKCHCGQSDPSCLEEAASILAQALRAERERCKRIEAETWEKAADFMDSLTGVGVEYEFGGVYQLREKAAQIRRGG